jgi:hypothetical protein
MKKIIFLSIIFIFCFLGCKKNSSESNIENKQKFHQNIEIDNIITKYNNISEYKINQKDLNNNYISQVFFGLDNIWVRIADNDSLKKVFIDLEEESLNLNNIKEHGAIFMKVLDNNLNDSNTKEIFNNLETYKYFGYNFYKFNNFEFKLTKDDLYNTKNKRYKLEISYQYN